ncbi:MAG: TRAP transporter small permease subunit [Rhizobiales bacterium]|nr:TRAP transporter small permease subunit [Hyphomicrobiales bacterium]
MRQILQKWRKFAELVAVGLLTAMFIVFLLQVFMRYVVNQPLGWTSEACVILYIWAVFWTSAFLLKESDHITFTIVSDMVHPSVKRIMMIVGHIVLGVAFASSLPAVVDYIAFMKIDTTPVTRIRFDYVFSIFAVFVMAVVVRAAVALYRAFFGKTPNDTAPVSKA